MSAHSALGPSAAHRWLVCPGSVNAERLARLANPNADTSSPYAEEGTRAHELCEYLLLNPDSPYEDDEVDSMEDQDMLRHALRYREYCQAQAGDNAIELVESRVTMPRVNDVCFGTADFAAYIPEYHHLHVIDLKYGQGIRVDAKDNPQAMLYAEGVRQKLYDEHRIKIKNYTVHIFQPRLRTGENISSFQFSNLQLDDFISHCAESALRTVTDVDTFVPGDKQCQWCIASPCKARADQMTSYFADQFEDIDDSISESIASAPLLTDAELGAWLNKAKALKSFISNIEALAYERAMDNKTIPGHKLVAGRGTYVARADALEFVLGDVIYKTKTLKSKSELERELGAAKFKRVALDLFERRSGKPTLATSDDPREAWSQSSDDELDSMFDDL